jgi:hypothetical protein
MASRWSTARFATTAMAVALALGAIACSGFGGDADGESCPAGATERTSTNGSSGPGAETREDAIRAELEEIGLDATDDAIAAGVVAAGPGGSVGTELVKVETENGIEVTMTLAPLDPGWAVEGSSWCVPDAT